MALSLSDDELGIIQTVLRRFDHQQLPELLDMKDRVDAGETLSEYHISCLAMAMSITRWGMAFANRHPEYQKLVAEISHFCEQITHQAVENELAA